MPDHCRGYANQTC